MTRLDLAHVLHWPPQPTTIAGVVIIAASCVLAPELALPALITGLVAIIGDDGSRPKEEFIATPVAEQSYPAFGGPYDGTLVGTRGESEPRIRVTGNSRGEYLFDSKLRRWNWIES